MRPDFDAVGDRLLDQHVDAGLDELARDLVMERRRHGDAGRIDPADDAAIIEGRLGAELRGDRAGALLVGIDDGDKLGARIAGIMIGVKAAKIAGAHHGDANLSAMALPSNPKPKSHFDRRDVAPLGRMGDACLAMRSAPAHRGDDQVLRLVGEIRMHGKADHALRQPLRLGKPGRRHGHLPVWAAGN